MDGETDVETSVDPKLNFGIFVSVTASRFALGAESLA